MEIRKGVTAAVIVSREWANLDVIRLILRQGHNPTREIRGDQSHLILAEILDPDDPHGLWIELNSHRNMEDSTIPRYSFLIPWGYILGISISEKFSPEIWEEARKLGF